MADESKLFVRVGKILSPEKLPDRLSVIFVHEPDNEEERKYGSLYFVIEILQTGDFVQHAAQNIVSTMIDEYYHNLYLEPFTSFEIALKKVNEELAAIAEANDTNWYGKLNAIICCLTGTELNITQTGNAEAYLIRANSVSHISQGLTTPGDRMVAFNPFINIASGGLQAKDKVILSTVELFNHISLDRLRRLAFNSSPQEIVSQLAKILKREKVVAVDTVVMESLTEDQISAMPLASEAEEIYLEEPKKTLETIISRSQGFLESSKVWAGKVWAKTKVFYKDTAAPSIGDFSTRSIKESKRFFNKSRDLAQKAIQEAKEKVENPAEKKHVEAIFGHPTVEDNGKPLLMATDETVPRPEPPKHKNGFEGFKASAIDLYHRSNVATKKALKKVASYSLPMKQKLGLEPTNPRYKENVKKLIIGLIIAFAVIFLISIVGMACGKKVEQKQVQTQTSFDLAWEKEKSGEAAIGFKDAVRAKELFAEALSLAQTADPTQQTDGYKQIAAEIQKQIDSLSGVNSEEPKLVTDLASLNAEAKPLGIFVEGSNIYSFDEQQKVYSVTTAGKASVASSATVIGQFSFGAKTADGKIVYYTDAKDVRQFDTATKKATQLSTTDGRWKNAVSIGTYFGNLYLLDPAGETIWKYLRSSSGYGSAIDYSKDNTNLENASSLAIDGFIYVLNANGSAFKYSQGFAKQYDLKGLPASPSNKFVYPTQIFTDESLDSVFVVDIGKNRIVEFSKDKQTYIRQWVNPLFENTKSIYVDSEKNKMFILVGTAIYSLDLK